MSHPIIGWEKESAIPSHRFNTYLSAHKGHLYYDDLNLANLFLSPHEEHGLEKALQSPLEIVYLPRIRQKIDQMRDTFNKVIQDVGYNGRFHYVYASKANAAEEVVRTTLGVGAHHETSASMDIEILRFMKQMGHLPSERMVVCNGFKPSGSTYAESIVMLKREHEAVIPVVDDLTELPPLIDSGLPFDLGLRQKSYGRHQDLTEMEAANSRFGMDVEGIWKAAEIISQHSHLSLKLYHAMVGSQILDIEDFIQRLRPPIEIFAQLRREYPELSIFDFGGGVPVPMTLDFQFDYSEFARQLLMAIKETCDRYDVPVPDVMGEFGRYTVAEHGAHLFKITHVKVNASQYPWYIIDGSIMSSFPDSWALGEHFTVLPLNNLDSSFQRVQLGGITCDSDDIYPPHKSQSPLLLPVDTENLYIGFFGIGAYQEMLGGVGGSKHCVIPEADELIIDRDEQGEYQFQLLQGQGVSKVLGNLGYVSERTYR
ncbi:MAG: arginine decarboxylase [Anaerolineales bacterium]|nr:arginine decarboxylase [Anaerolineales bacterium]